MNNEVEIRSYIHVGQHGYNMIQVILMVKVAQLTWRGSCPTVMTERLQPGTHHRLAPS